MITEAGKYHTLRVVKEVDFGFYLDGGESGEILLPTRFVPEEGLEPDDDIEVFIYHDGESRLIATTQTPLAVVGDIKALRCVSTTPQGAFLEWGIMKDVFLPLSQQVSRVFEGEKYLVQLYIDAQTGRVAATERFTNALEEYDGSLKEGQPVMLTIWAMTDLGFRVIVDNKFTGLLYRSDVFTTLEAGDVLPGYVRTIRPDGKLDVALGKRGHNRVKDSTEVLLEALEDANGYLPYNDKTSPEVIAEVFGMSKKVFKMAAGSLYKQRIIEFTQTGMKKVAD